MNSTAGKGEGQSQDLNDLNAVDALRESEARLRAAIDASESGTFRWDIITNALVWDEALDKLFGLPPGKTARSLDNFIAMVHPDDRALVISACEACAANGVDFSEEFRVVHPTGELRWLYDRGKTALGTDGRPSSMTGACVDVTERRAALAALAASEHRFRVAIDAVQGILWTNNAVGEMDGEQPGWAGLTGQSSGEYHGFGWTNAIHPDDIEPTIAAWKDAVANKRTFVFEHRLRRNDGQWRNYSIRSVPRVDDDGTTVEWVGVHTDVTDQRIAEQALRESEARLRDLNETLERRVQDAVAERKLFFDVVEGSDALWQIVDLDLRYLAINTAACQEFERIYGKRPKIGSVSIDMLAGWPERRLITQNLWNRALAGETFTSMIDLNASDIDPRWYEFKYAPLRDASGQVVGASASALDVTERVREQSRLAEAEEALRQAQKMEAVGQLTGGLAHDFNNLLTGMMGNLELLQARVQRGRYEDLDRFVNAAQGAGRRAASLTQRLLAFSRRQTLDPRPTDVNRLIVGVEELLRRTVGPTYNVEVVQAAGLWPTMIDPAQLENALLNLCINARDAMVDGGRITIETANKWLDDRTCRERDLPPGQYLSVCVTDTGTGMSPDVVARAFDPFYTTKPIGEGTGLGLSMIYGFARQSGGQVRIYSEVGTGTTVCIYLPRHAGEVEDMLVSAEPEALDGAKGETILVVDDEATIRHLIDEVLDDLGYTVIGAADGAAGLKVLQSSAKIELLITDVGLPNGMNGRQVADAARSMRPGLKVLFITGYAENAAVGNGHMEPGMELLTKPFAMADLSRKVQDMLAKGPGGATIN